MAIRFYDSLTASVQDLIPVTPGHIGMYFCGPTVQSEPHIGHLRSALIYDQVRRWLSYRGFDVTVIRNVTDIDDKILALATAQEPWWALAARVERAFTAAYDRLNILPPTYTPHATAHIPQMIELINRLIEGGHAYAATDGTGDVYFDAGSWPSYGELTRQSLADMEPAADGDPRGKRDPRDFALWKGNKASEPEDASWPSPWGRGRPGWHIECSAMAVRYLGATFDIHGGGLDLRFPHHENELAQSRAAGDGFARIWLHNGLVNVGGTKMSKSLGNFTLASDLFAQASPIVVRYFLGAAHYRSTVEFDPERSLGESEAAVERILGFLERAERKLSQTRYAELLTAAPVPEAFADAMDDDLSVPVALAVLHDTVRQGNAAMDAEQWRNAGESYGRVLGMLTVLGLNPRDYAETPGAQSVEQAALGELIDARLSEREQARQARDFARADHIRDELAAVGIQVEDTPAGPVWSINGK
ncbi:MAG TPA: cysteine--tRNA ligase [Pseudoclavibacter sp.]|nr:cysteine--tRNA ligase [Pseudoclavibacter sp.]